jgi:hypothetical protein
MTRNLRQSLIDTATAHLNGEVQVRMVFNTLREMTGRVLELKAAKHGKDFDWKPFKTAFEKQYGKLSLDELMTEATKFGLTSVEAVRAQRQQQLSLFYKRQEAFNRAKTNYSEFAELIA